MMKVIFWVVGLIALFLIVSNSLGVNSILGTLSDASIKGIATLQGRSVKGVTS